MARAPVQHIDDAEGRVIGYRWATLSTATETTCDPIRMTNFDDVTISVTGTMAGVAVAMHISNDTSATSFWPAKDANTAAALSLTVTDTAALVSEVGVWYKPVLATIDDTGTTSITVDLVAK